MDSKLLKTVGPVVGLAIIVGVVSSAGMWAGQTAALALKTEADPQPSTSTQESVRLWVDQGTGCEYLVTPTSITPRLYSDGYPVCPDIYGDADLDGSEVWQGEPWLGGEVLPGPDDTSLSDMRGQDLPGGWRWDGDGWVKTSF